MEGKAEVYVLSAAKKLVCASVPKLQDTATVITALETMLANAGSSDKIQMQQDYYTVQEKIEFKGIKDPWYVLVQVPSSYVFTNLIREMWLVSGVMLAFIALLVFILIKAIYYYLRPVQHTAYAAHQIAEGNLNQSLSDSDCIEIQELNTGFYKLMQSMKHITDVCVQIASGDFSVRAKVSGENDHLAKSVNTMVSYLEVSQCEQKDREWVNNGYSGALEILQTNISLEEMSNSILIYLAKYLELSQAKLYMTTEDGVRVALLLKGTYAYKRIKYTEEESIDPGQGLIGQAYLEQEPILLTDIPEGYCTISSGLGEAEPACVYIAPLLFNKKCEGILEVVFLHMPKEVVVELIDKCTVAMAGAFATQKVNQITSKLLEESKEQTELIRAQEEEMRQNLEELMATQKALERKQKE